ncbi:MAG: PQQ-like beta-propeller repeat protein [Candidatus Bathyarchaeota archaeon]|nr:PQQ-like beta-propeller repeat protein [Candidatus Bathyarchaeota archaeon]
MRIKQNNFRVGTSLILLLTLSLIATSIPLSNAADVPTYCFLTVSPNPIGVGQTLTVAFWLDKVTPNAATLYGDRWTGLMLTITKPDGTTETKGPFTLDAVATGYTFYTPTMVGKYVFQVRFPGQVINVSSTVQNNYLPSQSGLVELTVQQAAIAHWQDFPLPSGYWTRPLNAELRGVASIGSYWLAAGATGPHGPRAYDSMGNFQPYGKAPNTAHILWTREIAFGGAVGGAFGDNVYYPGETYERKFQPPIIMNGRLYYNLKLGSGSNLWDGAYCVDLYTGETIWYINATNKNYQYFTFGQLLNMDTPNQHGVIPYLWSVQGSTYKMYDAFSGDWILDLTGVPSGSMVMGKNGEFLIYTLNAAGNFMTLWNSTKAIYPTVDTSWRWMISPTTPNVTAGYQWNVSIPDVPGTQSIAKINNEYIYARATHQTVPTTITTDVAYDIKDGKPPVQLFVQNRTYEGTIMNGPMADGVFTTFVKETMVWYGYDVRTGSQKWGPTAPYTNAWGMYQPYADTCYGYGKLYAGGYDGTVHCYDLATGRNLWNYYFGSSGFETPYGTYPLKDNAFTVADGKVFVVTNEHSPNTPYFHGWKIHVIDANTGAPVWNMSFMGLAPIIADGYALTLNYFDNRIYCFGVGPSATTVTASPKVSTLGSSVLIEGTVTDQSPGAKGTPAIADEDMSEWMECLYQQRPAPMDAKGVPVKLIAYDPNGNIQQIGTVTTDSGGLFKKLWTPPVPGEYTIIAMFEGSASYGSSEARTAIGVVNAPSPAPTETPTAGTTTPAPSTPTVTSPPLPSPSVVPEPEATPSIDVYIISAALIVVIAVVAVAALLLRKRK